MSAAPGDLDPIGSGGKIVTNFGGSISYSSVGAVLIQPDDKIVAVGVAYISGPSEFAIARYMPDGTPDPDFGSAGKVTTDLGGFDQASAAVLQGDGKIVVAGFTYDGISDYDFALARYNDDGTLDGSFGTSGIVTTELGGADLGSALVVQPDGKLVMAGRVSSDFVLTRYNSDGTLDATFGSGGIVVTDLAPDATNSNTSLALQADGRLVVAGSIGVDLTDAEDIAVARYESDGSLDATFGTLGIASVDVGATQNVATDVLVQPDGKLLLACWPGFACGVVRLNADGSPDLGFGSGGHAPPLFSTDNFYHLSLQADGRILAVGASNDLNEISDFSVTRYAADGSPDLTYGVAGSATIDFELSTDRGLTSVLQTDGNLVVAGQTFAGQESYFALARYRGDIDPTTCTATPVIGCQAALPGAKLQLRDDALDSKDKVSFTWKSAAVLPSMDFASPTTTSDYAFCVYDATGRRLALNAPAGQICAGKSCWKSTTSGFKYGDKWLSPDGLSKLALVAGDAIGKGKITVKGKGEFVVMPTLDFTLPVVAQVQESTGACWEASYTTVISSDSERFQAASD